MDADTLRLPPPPPKKNTHTHTRRCPQTEYLKQVKRKDTKRRHSPAPTRNTLRLSSFAWKSLPKTATCPSYLKRWKQKSTRFNESGLDGRSASMQEKQDSTGGRQLPTHTWIPTTSRRSHSEGMSLGGIRQRRGRKTVEWV